MAGKPPSNLLGGPISVLKSFSSRANSVQTASPGAESSSSDEGLTMSISRQQASRSTAFVNRKREITSEVAGRLDSARALSSDAPVGGPTVQNLEKQFDAVEEKEVRQVSNAAALSPSPLSPLSLSSTPMGPSRTTSGMSNVTADSHLALKGPSLVRPVTPLSPLGLPLSGAAQHFTRNNNPLAEASGAGLSDTPAASTAGFSRLRMNHPIDQEDDDVSSGTLAPDEPYLRNNPAFEAYMDSDDGSSTGSVESNACTTPRSAIHEQVAGSPWLGRVRNYIQSPPKSSARAVAKSAPPTVQRGPSLYLHSEGGARRGGRPSSDIHGAVSRALFHQATENAAAAQPSAHWPQTATLATAAPAQQGSSSPPLQPAQGRHHTAPASPCRDWASVYDMPEAAQVQQAAAVVERLQQGQARAAAAATASRRPVAVSQSPAGRDVLRAAALVGRLHAGVQRDAAQLRSAQNLRAAETAAKLGSEPVPPVCEKQAQDEAQPLREASEARVLVNSSLAADVQDVTGLGPEKLRKRTASLSILASGCSDAAELPTTSSGTGKSQPSNMPVQKQRELPKSLSKGGRGSWLHSCLLFCFLSVLLGGSTLLMSGSYMAGSTDRLASLKSGSYGAAAAAFGHCVSHLQPPAETQHFRGRAGSAASDLALQGACMYSTARREAVLTWTAARPILDSHLSTACTAARHAATILTARVSPFLHSIKLHAAEAVASSQLLSKQLGSAAADTCPKCAAAIEAAVQHVQAGAETMLDSWVKASSAGKLGAPPLSELYHSASLLRRIPGHVEAATQALTVQIAPLVKSSQQWLAGAVPPPAKEAAQQLAKQMRKAAAACAALLAQSDAAVLPEHERIAAAATAEAQTDSMQQPQGLAQLAAAARTAGGWLGGWRANNSAQPRQEPAPSGEAAQDAPSQPHVLRWTGSSVIEGHQPPLDGQKPELAVHGASSREVAANRMEESLDEQTEQAAASQPDVQSAEEAAESNEASEDSMCMTQGPCSDEHHSAAAWSDGSTSEDGGLLLPHDGHNAEAPAPESPEFETACTVEAADNPADSQAAAEASEEVQPSAAHSQVAHQGALEEADVAEAKSLNEGSTYTTTTEDQVVSKATGKSSSWTDAMWAAAVLAPVALVAFALFFWRTLRPFGQQLMFAFLAQGQPPSVAASGPDLPFNPLLMDLTAHAPSRVLIPSGQEDASKVQHRTPTGRRGRPGAGSTPGARSAGPSAAQRTAPQSAPAAAWSSEPRVTRARSRFAETPRRTPRATAYPGPWQE